MLFCVEQQGFGLSADVVGVTNYSYIAFYYYKLYMVKQNDQKNSKKRRHPTYCLNLYGITINCLVTQILSVGNEPQEKVQYI